MGEMGEMGSENCQVPLDHQGTKETEENWDHLDHRERGGYQDHRERGGYQDHLDHREYLVSRGLLERKVIVETLACQDLKENQEEGQCMFAGGGPLVPLTRELNYYTLEELEGVIIIKREEVPTIFVYQIILNICSIPVESRDKVIFME